MKNFALIGAAGYIAPKHMKAIKDTGNNLIAALDKSDSVGILDSYFPEADFFTEFERFDRHLEKLKRQGIKTDFLTVCSPNYLHDAHIRFGLRLGADVICEKPVVLNPWNIEALEQMENETGKKVYSIFQLRLHPSVVALKEKISKDTSGKKYSINLQYITSRGNWYHSSWKGDVSKSGGIATNIGIHFFDMLIWIFGDVQQNTVNEHSSKTASGKLELEKATVNWTLSIDANMLPNALIKQNKTCFKILEIDNKIVEINNGFTDLHTQSYKEVLNGKGFHLSESRKVIELVHDIRNYKS